MFDLTENGMNPQARLSGGIESAPDDSFVSESTTSQTRSCAFPWPREGKSSKPDELIGWGGGGAGPASVTGRGYKASPSDPTGGFSAGWQRAWTAFSCSMLTWV